MVYSQLSSHGFLHQILETSFYPKPAQNRSLVQPYPLQSFPARVNCSPVSLMSTEKCYLQASLFLRRPGSSSVFSVTLCLQKFVDAVQAEHNLTCFHVSYVLRDKSQVCSSVEIFPISVAYLQTSIQVLLVQNLLGFLLILFDTLGGCCSIIEPLYVSEIKVKMKFLQA